MNKTASVKKTVSYGQSYSQQKNLQKGINVKVALKYAFERESGKLVDNKDRAWILRLFYWLKCQNEYIEMTDWNLMNMVADCSGCSYPTIKTIIESDSAQVKDERGHTKLAKINMEEEEDLKDDILRHVKNSLQSGKPVVSKDVRAWLSHQRGIDVSKTTILNYLHNWGVDWGRTKVQEYRKEREAVLIQRYEFLHDMVEELNVPLKTCNHKRCGCERRRELVYLDESYLNEHHVSEYSLMLKDVPLQKPTGKGRRIVIAGAITEEGWIGYDYNKPQIFKNAEKEYEVGALKYWTANVGNDDYHRNFNFDNFYDYFETSLLPNLKHPSLIVIDGASYHREYAEDTFFPSKARKEELKNWLLQNNKNFPEKALKNDLKLLVMTYWSPPSTLIQTLAAESGKKRFGYEHRVIYLPPYHPEYSAVERAWADIKLYIGRNPSYQLEDILENKLPEALNLFTQEKARNIIQSMVKSYYYDSGREVELLDIDDQILDLENNI